MISTIITIAGFLLALIFIGFFISVYNSLIRLKNNIERAWSNIDVLLKQRHDELNNLVETVKGYMKHEKKVLENITMARTEFLKAKSVHDKAIADAAMEGALKSLFAVAENYPQLRANENFLKLQKRISEIEDHIADRREFYNDSVNVYNIRIEQFPDMLIANLFKYTRKEFFKIDEHERQSVALKI
jgi:LemA protein